MEELNPQSDELNHTNSRMVDEDVSSSVISSEIMAQNLETHNDCDISDSHLYSESISKSNGSSLKEFEPENSMIVSNIDGQSLEPDSVASDLVLKSIEKQEDKSLNINQDIGSREGNKNECHQDQKQDHGLDQTLDQSKCEERGGKEMVSCSDVGSSVDNLIEVSSSNGNLVNVKLQKT